VHYRCNGRGSVVCIGAALQALLAALGALAVQAGRNTAGAPLKVKAARPVANELSGGHP